MIPNSHYTLACVSDPRIFREHYPAIADAARELLRGRPGIGAYRFVFGHVAGDGAVKSGEPIKASIQLKSATRLLLVRLLPDERGGWTASVGTDRELEPRER